MNALQSSLRGTKLREILLKSRLFFLHLFPVSVLVSLLAALLGVYFWLNWVSENQFRKKDSIMPGPTPWPIIGSLHLMASFKKYPFEVFTKLREVCESIYFHKVLVQ